MSKEPDLSGLPFQQPKCGIQVGVRCGVELWDRRWNTSPITVGGILFKGPYPTLRGEDEYCSADLTLSTARKLRDRLTVAITKAEELGMK